MISGNHLGIVDYLVVAGTLIFSVLIGVYYAYKGNETNEEMLVGGRKMSVWPIACSIMVTYLSAITILGYPAEIYSHGIQVFMMTITCIIFIPLGTVMFVYVFYNLRLTSVYEYLELRFETKSIRFLASVAFILQVVVVTGVVLYAPSIALKALVGLPIWASVVGIGVIGTVYTSVGGLKAVVITDMFQFFMIFIGMMAMVIRGFMKVGGIYKALNVAEKYGRLELFDLNVDLFQRHNTLNFLLGYGFNVLCLYGTHQPQVQRYCSLPSFKLAVRSIMLSICLNVLTMSLVLATGISIFATYGECDPVLLGEIKTSDAIVPHFVLNELAFIPGMMGLFVSCVFSAVLSTLSSILNSLAAVTWTDFLSRIPRFQKMSDKGQANISKIISIVYGILTILLAFGAQYMGPILQATLTAVGATTGPIGAVFFIGLFLPCVNKWGVLGGMVSGLVSMVYIGIMSFTLDKPFFVPLPTTVDNCPIGTNFTNMINAEPPTVGVFEWPHKIYTLSYIMYPFVGACITIFMSILISGVTGGFCSAHKVKKKYLHPLLRGYFGREEEVVDEVDTFKPPPTYKNVDRVTGIHDRLSVQSPNPTTQKIRPYQNYNYEAVPTSPSPSPSPSFDNHSRNSPSYKYNYNRPLSPLN